MKTWNLPNILRGGGTCLILAAWLPLAGQEPAKARPEPQAPRTKGPERSGGQAQGRTGGEAAGRVQLQGRGEGAGASRSQAPGRSVGEAQNRNQAPSHSVGEASSRAQAPSRSVGEASNRAQAQESAPPPVHKPVQLPGPTQGPSRPVTRTPVQEPQPGRVQPAPGGGAVLRGEPARQPGPSGTQPGPGRPGPVEARTGSGPRLATPPTTIIARPPAGGEVRREPGGALREVRTPSGAVIRYAPDGQRRVEVDRPDGRMFVATPGGRGGYVQRPLRIQGQAFVQRTYVHRGVATARIYRPWAYHGVTYAVYQPVRYYRPGFYLWARRPWYRPVYYEWGWRGQPWFGYYRGWCSPYPTYTSPVFWLTDFTISITLEEAYQARMDSAAASVPPPAAGGLTPEVKQAIADEVQRQLAEEQAQQGAAAQGSLPAPSGPPPLFSDNVSRIFLVHTGIPVYVDGQERFLSEGDVLQLQGAPSAGAAFAEVKVLASHNPQCPAGSRVSVGLVDLQEMQNHMQATLDQGLDRLQSQQGQDGLPALPAQNLGTTDAPYLAGVQPEASAAAELSKVAQEAADSGLVVSQGMTVEEVHRVLGSPRETASVGGKLIEVFPNFKITYLEGRVTDVQ
jgi:hypothetical protein